jgi:hypothetical protein
MQPARILTEREVAHHLGKSETQFHRDKEALEAAGLPKIDPVTGGRDLHAIDHWLDQRSKLCKATSSDLNGLVERRLGGMKVGKRGHSSLSCD